MGDLWLDFGEVPEASNYRRELDLDTGIASVQYAAGGVRYTREVFASAPCHCIVVRLTADRPGSVSFHATMTRPADATTESAVGKLIMTGQAQGFSQTDFKTQVCNRLAGGLFDCNSVYVNVQTYSSYAAINTASPISSGQFDTTQMAYNAGAQGSIVVVTLYYEWPIYVSLLGSNLSNLNGGSRLLVATSVFRNEPY